MTIEAIRIYDGDKEGGYRVLVDRLWPRGISKEKARLDDWWKDLAPSTELRQWFGHDPDKWSEFKTRYKKELRPRKDQAKDLLKSVTGRKLVLLYGTKDEEHNHALVLQKYLLSL